MAYVTITDIYNNKKSKIKLPNDQIIAKLRIFDYRFMINKTDFERNIAHRNKYVCTHCKTGANTGERFDTIEGCLNHIKYLKKTLTKNIFKNAIEKAKQTIKG